MRGLALVLLLLAAGCASTYERVDVCDACGSVREMSGRRLLESMRPSELASSQLLAGLHRHEWRTLSEHTENMIACDIRDLSNELSRNLESSAELRESLRDRIRHGEVTAMELEKALHVRERPAKPPSETDRAVYARVLAVATSCPGWDSR